MQVYIPTRRKSRSGQNEPNRSRGLDYGSIFQHLICLTCQTYAVFLLSLLSCPPKRPLLTSVLLKCPIARTPRASGDDPAHLPGNSPGLPSVPQACSVPRDACRGRQLPHPLAACPQQRSPPHPAVEPRCQLGHHTCPEPQAQAGSSALCPDSTVPFVLLLSSTVTMRLCKPVHFNLPDEPRRSTM